MKSFIALLVTLTVEIASANARPFVTWLLEPKRTDSASMEVWEASKGERVWRIVAPGGVVIAQMDQPAAQPGYVFNWGDCKIGGDMEHGVIAVVRHTENQEWSEDIVAAWLADSGKGRFI